MAEEDTDIEQRVKTAFVLYDTTNGRIWGSGMGEIDYQDKWAKSIDPNSAAMEVDEVIDNYELHKVVGSSVVEMDDAEKEAVLLKDIKRTALNEVYLAFRAKAAETLGPHPRAADLDNAKDTAIAAIKAATSAGEVAAATAQFETDFQ